MKTELRILSYLLIIGGLLVLIQTKSRAENESLSGKSVKVSDGDTFTLLDADNNQHRIRLTRIDTPEMGQDYSKKAKAYLAQLIVGKTLRVETQSKDRYGRVLGEVYVGSLNVNTEMIRSGFAWHYKKYDSSPALAELERNARSQKLGLWAGSKPVAPWSYRLSKK